MEFNVASLVEDVLQQQGKRLCEADNFTSRRAQEASLKRYEAAGWLRKMVGIVLGKDLPAEPSEEDFRIGLRSGIILCTVLNKIQPASVPKVVEAPVDSVMIPDGAALTAFQYFENVRNFLLAIQEMGIPTFEVSDLEQGGKSFRIVNCIIALKSYHEWKQCGGHGVWKFSGNATPCNSVSKPHQGRKNSDMFLSFLSRNSSSAGDSSSITDDNVSPSLQKLVCELLSDKSAEEIPIIVESIISRVKKEFERRLERQTKVVGAAPHDESDSTSCMSSEIEATSNVRKADSGAGKDFCNEASENLPLKQQDFIDLQHRTVEELRKILNSTKQGMNVLQLKYQEDVDSLGEQVVRLANLASGYQKVLEENRKLYNQVQDLKGNIRVYCRVRPFIPGQSNGLNILDNVVDNSLTIQTSGKHGKGKKTFSFSKAFGPNSTQEEVFADTQPLIRSVLDGYNVCIFAYGQTGSGKTYTMTGPKELTKESLGVNYRALSDLFEISEERKDAIAYSISVQMMEIYNEQVRDLLVTDGSNKRLEIRNNSSNGINVPNANLVNVASTSDVIDLMNLGHKNRAVGSTSMNERSSRSHSCLTVHVQGKDLTSGATLRGCMHLVDLAGSERCDKTDAVGDRLKEAQHINRSLSALGDVIAALAQKNGHVPYRNSKLTQLLQDSLGGQAKTLMFVHISPEYEALGETLSTLKFAERVSTVELGAAKSNKDTSAPDVKELKEQIAMLRAALARKEGAAVYMGSPTSSVSVSSPSHSYKTESNSSSRRQSFESQDSWPTIQEAVKTVSRSSSQRMSPEVLFDNKRSPVASTKIAAQSLDDSDLEAEQDYQVKTTSLAASKLKRPTTKVVKTQETRSQIPQPSGRVGGMNKAARPVSTSSSSLVRRKTAGGK
ncbi:kinesin-like protein KIN-14I [Salvia hispanica]|uniref:kinesin-like protein KIN-14I n=1 Tax=Salvia hispanica TaxID=49212 RepID=UPI00200903A1|nr:kinesin-like protein KIN-14I [Salvia hispanica]